jgi:Ca-activated chloride channel family protein
VRALEIPDAAPYGNYGLGVIAMMLNEEEQAMTRFSSALWALDREPPNLHRELRYRLHYNTGLIHFEMGDSGAAAASFRRALEADSARIDAKRNLELCRISQEDGERRRSASQSAPDISGPGRTILEYIRSREEEQWKSREWSAGEEGEGEDY